MADVKKKVQVKKVSKNRESNCMSAAAEINHKKKDGAALGKQQWQQHKIELIIQGHIQLAPNSIHSGCTFFGVRCERKKKLFTK